MPRMLTKEEVERMEEQRELIDRARKAGNATAGMSEEERQRYVFNQAHADAMERRRQRVLADPSAEADTTYRHRVMRDAELRAARAHEAGMQGRELATREEEARQKRMGMAEQGMEAAKLRFGFTDYEGKYRPGGEVRLAEIQAANAEKIAGIKKESEMGVAKINAESNEKISQGRDKTAIEVANVNYDTSVDTERVRANAQAAQQYAQDLMRERHVDEKKALEYGKSVMADAYKLVNASRNKQTGKPTLSMDDAIKKVEEERRRMGQVPGEPRDLSGFKR